MRRSDNGGPDGLERRQPVVRCGHVVMCSASGPMPTWDSISDSVVLMPANPEDLPETFQVEGLKCLHTSDADSPGLGSIEK